MALSIIPILTLEPVTSLSIFCVCCGIYKHFVWIQRNYSSPIILLRSSAYTIFANLQHNSRELSGSTKFHNSHDFLPISWWNSFGTVARPMLKNFGIPMANVFNFGVAHNFSPSFSCWRWRHFHWTMQRSQSSSCCFSIFLLIPSHRHQHLIFFDWCKDGNSWAEKSLCTMLEQ